MVLSPTRAVAQAEAGVLVHPSLVSGIFLSVKDDDENNGNIAGEGPAGSGCPLARYFQLSLLADPDEAPGEGLGVWGYDSDDDAEHVLLLDATWVLSLLQSPNIVLIVLVAV